MDKTVHIFINKEMTELASAVSYYISTSCSSDVFSDIYFISLNASGDNNYRIAVCNNNKWEEVKEINAKNASIYFSQLYGNIKTVGDTSTILYTYVYTQLYEEDQTEILDFVIDNIFRTGNQFEINIYGLAHDLISIFKGCNDNYDLEQLKTVLCQNCEHLSEYKKAEKIRRILLLQDSNVKGLGINFNKEKLVRFFGEFAALTTEHNPELFPTSALNNKDYTSLGMSSIWYDEKMYVDYTSAFIIFKILTDQGVHKRGASMIDSKHLLIENKEIVASLSKIFGENLKSIDSLKDEKDIEKIYATVDERILSIKNRKDLNLYEKLCLLSLLCGKTFKTSDKKVIADGANYVGKAFNEIYQWYIDRNNEIIDKGEISIFSCPKDENGYVYLPEQRLADLRKSIEQKEKDIDEQEKKVIQLESEARKHKKDSFEFNNVYYKLVHDIKEEPLETTYKPKNVPLESVDMRNMFSPIRSQGGLGACSTFTLGSIFEFVINCFKGNTSSSLSPRFLYYNVSDKDASGKPIDNGSTFKHVLKILGDIGICKEELCRYSDDFEDEPSQEAIEDAKTRLVTKAENVRITHRDITSALTDGYPVAISLKLYKSFTNAVHGFVFRPSDEEIKSGDEGNHAMVICGYSEKDKVYIVRNSWGTDFGDNGYCYIPFSYIEDTNLCNMACIVTGVSCNELHGYKPKGDVKFDLSDESIEYAVAKILLDEEKQYLKHQKTFYIQLYRDYCRLLLELNDPEKRLEVKKEYLKLYNNRVCHTGVNVTPGPNPNNKIPAIIAAVSILLSLCLLLVGNKDNGILIVSFLLALIGVGSFLYYLLKLKGFGGDTSHPLPTPTDPVDKKNELKFAVADESLRCVQNTGNIAKEAYWDMLFYIQELETLYNENAINLDKADKLLDSINKPFTFVFTKEEMQYVQIDNLKLNIDIYLEMGDDRSNFRKAFVSNIRKQIAEIHKNFSMIDYFISLEGDAKAKCYINNLQAQSMPFAEQIVYMGKIKQFTVFIDANDTEKEKSFSKFCDSTFANPPAQSYGCSPNKFICVSVDDFDKKDLKLLN